MRNGRVVAEALAGTRGDFHDEAMARDVKEAAATPSLMRHHFQRERIEPGRRKSGKDCIASR